MSKVLMERKRAVVRHCADLIAQLPLCQALVELLYVSRLEVFHFKVIA